ncbi:hypothetical protein ABAC460_17165 [Asticcacaulis sp. AC460]|uniref:AAA family ATPase n=1 Tax=Asticcacaulis sp. AC460 TaxID=1282360 RepID=UPI0003C3E2A5|nr:AAA family ATPase [Asticcacaulis sp. AC460]ESQ87921.1 hypothetical protein ABAC460_17165 [Asticcacaulis sp. AC460]
MIIRDVSIENFRKFRKPLVLNGFSSGINLLAEPNETGKSTILEAMRAVLFERHGSKSEWIQSFRPHSDDVAPTVEMTFEVGKNTYKLRKRFIQKPEVVLEGPDGRFTSDQAEEHLQSLLGFSRPGNRGADWDSRGALGLLWVEQGQSFSLDAPGQTARRTLEEVLAGQVGTVTGGRRTTAIVEAIEKSLSELLTASGKPTKKYAEAIREVEDSEAEAEAARIELGEFGSILDALESNRNTLRRLNRDLNDPEREAQIKQLNEDIQGAQVAHSALQLAELKLKEATGAHDALEKRATRRATLQTELEAARKRLSGQEIKAKESIEAVDRARTSAAEANAALDAARLVAVQTASARQAAEARRGEIRRAKSLAIAFDRLDAAELLAKEIGIVATTLAQNKISKEAIDSLESADRKIQTLKVKAAAGAVHLRMLFEIGAPEIRVNGVVVSPNYEALFADEQTVELAGLGKITIEPPQGGESALLALGAAESDMSSLLRELDVANLAEAHLSARSRQDLERKHDELNARLQYACPADAELQIAEGLDALRGALSALERPDSKLFADVGTDDTKEIQAYEDAQSALAGAEGRREAAQKTLQEAEIAEARISGDMVPTQNDIDRLSTEARSEISELSEIALAEILSHAKSHEGRMILEHDQFKRAAESFDLSALTKKRDYLNKQIKAMADERPELTRRIGALEQQAKDLGGKGPAARAIEASELLDAVIAKRDRIAEEAEVLSLLSNVIKVAQQEASIRYLAPITKKVAPYVKQLIPNANMAFGEDYIPQSLIRGDRTEATAHLSKGTQEQLAVLTRIAFADLLLEKGKPASLVLDDALVFADDDRFETMLDILGDAAKRMQVIILSCRTAAYRPLKANRIMIE